MTQSEAFAIYEIDEEKEVTAPLNNGVNADSITEKIRTLCKSKFKTLAMKCHPDRKEHGGSHEKMLKLQEATEFFETSFRAGRSAFGGGLFKFTHQYYGNGRTTSNVDPNSFWGDIFTDGISPEEMFHGRNSRLKTAQEKMNRAQEELRKRAEKEAERERKNNNSRRQLMSLKVVNLELARNKNGEEETWIRIHDGVTFKLFENFDSNIFQFEKIVITAIRWRNEKLKTVGIQRVENPDEFENDELDLYFLKEFRIKTFEDGRLAITRPTIQIHMDMKTSQLTAHLVRTITDYVNVDTGISGDGLKRTIRDVVYSEDASDYVITHIRIYGKMFTVDNKDFKADIMENFDDVDITEEEYWN